VYLEGNLAKWIFFGTKNRNKFEIIEENHPQYSFVENHMKHIYSDFIDEDKTGLFVNLKKAKF
jgi:hypothetical protein